MADTDKKLIDILPENLHKSMYEELKEKFETPKSSVDPDIVAFAKRNDEKFIKGIVDDLMKH